MLHTASALSIAVNTCVTCLDDIWAKHGLGMFWYRQLLKILWSTVYILLINCGKIASNQL